MKHFSLLNLQKLEEIFISNDIQKYRAKQVFDGIYKNFASNFDNINNIPKDLKTKLNNILTIDTLEIIEKSSSSDGTCKYLLKLEDQNYIECVYLPYLDRKSICISTQVGCPIGCKFCASGANGFIRNLTTFEILGQILTVQSDVKEKITHIVYMGIGEPLLNLDNVINSIKIINSNFNISQRRITVSTSGIVAKIYELASKNLDITLALSLHSPYQDQRCEIIPSAKHNILPKLLFACDEYFQKTNRRITWEYILIDKFNCDEKTARDLSILAKKHKAHINLIPYNSTDNNEFKRPNEITIKKFTNILKQNNNQFSLREKKGNNENSACGQLRNRNIKNLNN